MNTQEKVQHICEMLKTLGEPGSAHQLAEILAMCPDSIIRYLNGEVQHPKNSSKESIDILYRVLVNAINGNTDARKVLDAAIGHQGILRMGLGGALITLGMTWLVRDPKVEERFATEQKEERPSDEKSNGRKKTSQRRSTR